MWRALAWWIAAGGVSLAGCADDPPATGCGPDDVAAGASDVVVVTNAEASLYFAVADPLSPAAASTSAAPVASAVASTFPGGCATARSMQNVVTLQLDDCSGPLGLVHATGTVTAKIFSLGSGDIGIDLSGDNVAADGGNFTLNTSASLTAASDGRKALRATSMSNGTGPSGNSVDHAGTFTLLWAPSSPCATLDATFAGIATGGYGGASMTIDRYVACTGACPQSGTAVAAFDGGNLTLTYDGAPYAFCSASGGRSAALTIPCP